LPGETIELKRKIVHVNGQRSTSRYVHFLTPASSE